MAENSSLLQSFEACYLFENYNVKNYSICLHSFLFCNPFRTKTQGSRSFQCYRRKLPNLYSQIKYIVACLINTVGDNYYTRILYTYWKHLLTNIIIYYASSFLDVILFRFLDFLCNAATADTKNDSDMRTVTAPLIINYGVVKLSKTKCRSDTAFIYGA